MLESRLQPEFRRKNRLKAGLQRRVSNRGQYNCLTENEYGVIGMDRFTMPPTAMRIRLHQANPKGVRKYVLHVPHVTRHHRVERPLDRSEPRSPLPQDRAAKPMPGQLLSGRRLRRLPLRELSRRLPSLMARSTCLADSPRIWTHRIRSTSTIRRATPGRGRKTCRRGSRISIRPSTEIPFGSQAVSRGNIPDRSPLKCGNTTLLRTPGPLDRRCRNARAGGGLAVVERKLHYFGGYKADRDTNAGDHWSLSLEGGKDWQREADLPDPRGHVSAAVLDGKIYALGGDHGHDITAD